MPWSVTFQVTQGRGGKKPENHLFYNGSLQFLRSELDFFFMHKTTGFVIFIIP